MPLTRRHILFAACAVTVSAVTPACADRARLFAPGGVAIGGYDPVAYFTQGRAVAGTQDYMLKWHGAIWLFSSAENLEAFEMDPAAFVPQYGGYCAYGVGEGLTASSDPQIFVVHDGRLYLYSSPRTRSEMESDFSQMVADADRNWPNFGD
jgi:YHS domain-containing protein